MNRIHIKYGVIAAVLLIAYFLLVRLAGLHETPWLSLINGMFVGYGIYAAIKQKKSIQGEAFTYYSGFKTGVVTGFIATVIFVVFMAVYMFHLDTAFPEEVMKRWLDEYNQGPEALLFIIGTAGAASTVVLTLTFMQKFKRPQDPSSKSPENQ